MRCDRDATTAHTAVAAGLALVHQPFGQWQDFQDIRYTGSTNGLILAILIANLII